MKIAVTFENGNVFQHFGHTEFFKLYQVENGVVTDQTVVSAIGSGHGALAGFLKNHQVDKLICGGIGAGARTALANAQIEVYPGVSGNADDSVQALLAGRLVYNPDTTCHHHDQEGHTCGSHHDGEHHGCGNHCGEDHRGCPGNH